MSSKYKHAITANGENFIKNKCNELIYPFTTTVTDKKRLVKSTVQSGTIFTANILSISSKDDYAKKIINWINEFSELFILDANIVASHIYAESMYNPSYYSTKGTMGISGIIDYEVFKFIIKSSDYDNFITPSLIQINISGDLDDIRTYIPNVNTTNKKITSSENNNANAKNNRKQLFQNIIDNPKESIFVQCYLLSLYGSNNNNLAASSLIAYYYRSIDKTTKYQDLINILIKKYDSNEVNFGIRYVDTVFKTLGNFYSVNYEESKLQISNSIEINNSYLKVNSSVRVTPIIANTIRGLDEYFKNNNLNAVVTSGFRDKFRQLQVIISYLKREKIDSKYSDAINNQVDDKNGDGTYKWQLGWSALMNAGYVINPPIGAKLLLDSTRNGVLYKPAGTFIGTTPHSSGRSFDVSGAPLNLIEEVLKRAKQDGKLGIKNILVEPQNNALHVDCSESDKFEKSDSEID